MKTATKPKKAKAKQMTDAARLALVNSLHGKYAWVGGSSEDLVRERRAEVEREEAEFAKRYLKRATNSKK